MTAYHLFQLTMEGSGEMSAASEQDAWFRARIGQVTPAITLGLHRLTALVDAADLEDLFHKTNSLEKAWPVQHPPRQLYRTPCSTSVGDVAVDLENAEVSLCASFGWENLGADQAMHFLILAAEHAPDEQFAPIPEI